MEKTSHLVQFTQIGILEIFRGTRYLKFGTQQIVRTSLHLLSVEENVRNQKQFASSLQQVIATLPLRTTSLENNQLWHREVRQVETRRCACRWSQIAACRGRRLIDHLRSCSARKCRLEINV